MTDLVPYLDMTATIVSAFVGHNTVRASELPELIAAVHSALSNVSVQKPINEPVPELKPAVSIKKSVTDDFIICLEDGKKFKSLRRHLATAFSMTPDEYRAKWSLPRDYPMVAPGYAATRSALAKATGLGSARRKASAEPVEPVSAPVAQEPVKRRGRPKKAA